MNIFYSYCVFKVKFKINIYKHHGLVKVTYLESKHLVLNLDKLEGLVRYPGTVTKMKP